MTVTPHAHDEHARLGRALRDLGGLMMRLGEALDGREPPENLGALAKRIVAEFDQTDDVGWFAALSDAVGGLDDDEKGAATIRTPGGDQPATVVSESGLYSLVLRSRKPEATRATRSCRSLTPPESDPCQDHR